MIRPAGAAAITALVLACGRSRGGGDGTGPSGGIVFASSSATSVGVPRAGMEWIPVGTLRSGSAVDDVPRVADAEPAPADVDMNGFYIDALPWPDEPGAIPTTNVTRDEARRLCASRSKRLCSELEWERACKGAGNTRYEYGASYDPRACGAGAPVEMAARRPSGQRLSCRSSFGVQEMHGGAFEWTDSSWGRGGSADLGVLRGGSDPDGELVSRCAYARSSPLTDHTATIGFRCCAGPRNQAEVHLDVSHGVAFESVVKGPARMPPFEALDGVACGPQASPAPCAFSRAWIWRPSPNVELLLAGGCVGHVSHYRCAMNVSRTFGESVRMLAQLDMGAVIPEAALVSGAAHRVRVRGGDIHGWFFRELSFDYGRVDVVPAR